MMQNGSLESQSHGCRMGRLPSSSVVFVPGTSQEIPNSQASPQMGAQSPGPPIVKVVHCEDLNKKILISLIVSSTLLYITVMFLLYLLLWRYTNLKNNFTGIKQNFDCVKSSVSTKPIVHKFETVRKGTIPMYEYQLLESGTNKFSVCNVLSRGGRGCLYRACIDEKSPVTVKKLDGGGETDIEKQFEAEVDWLAKIRLRT